LDATNSIHSQLSVLTRIDYDHTEILGEHLHQIAREKAGIIKKHGSVIALKQNDEVNYVFEKVAKDQQANLDWVELPQQTDSWSAAQLENSLLAASVLNHVFPNKAPRQSFFLKIPLRGRLQHISFNQQEYLLDGAHNRISMLNLKQYIQSFDKPVQCLFAMGDSRSAFELLQALDNKCITEYVFFKLPGGRPGLNPHNILKEFESFSDKPAKVSQDFQQWCQIPFDGIKLVTGSIYLVGEALKELQ
jgi:folylpolyglutamate synthase/dihydropteroate synthase